MIRNINRKYRRKEALFILSMAFVIQGVVTPVFAATAPTGTADPTTTAATAATTTAGTTTGTTTAATTTAGTTTGTTTATTATSGTTTGTTTATTATSGTTTGTTTAATTTAGTTTGTTTAATTTTSATAPGITSTPNNATNPGAAAQTTVSGQKSTVSTNTNAVIPGAIYAVKSVSGSVILQSKDAADLSSVSEHLEENLKAQIDVAIGTTLTTEEWQNAKATVSWDAAPEGYDPSKKGDYSFKWSGTIKKDSMVYTDATKVKGAIVPADMRVTVEFAVKDKSGSVSGDKVSKAPTTGDDFNAGMWAYLAIIGFIVVLCAFILYRDVKEN